MVTKPRIKFQIQQSNYESDKAQIIETRLEIGCKIMTEVASSLQGQQLPSHAQIYDKAASMLWQPLQ